MHRLLTALGVLTVLAGAPAAPAASAAPAEPRYALDLDFDAAAHAVSGTQRISFINDGSTALRSVWLRVWANGPRGCLTRGVSVRLAAGARAGRSAASCTALEARLSRPLRPGARSSITLALRLVAPARPDERFARARGASSFANALPVLAVRDAGGPDLSPWVGNRAESFHSAAARWRVAVTAPRRMRAVMTGQTTGERRRGARVTMTSTALARDFALAVGPFRPVAQQHGGVLVRFWRLPDTQELHARRAVSDAVTAMRLFDRWGAYPGRELDLVDSNLAMEYPELVLTGTSAYTVVHEVAHQWFYGLVGNDQYAHPWLDESLSSYATGLALRAIEMPDAAESRTGDGGCRTARGGEAGRPMSYWRTRAAEYGPVVYGQGECAFIRLEVALGRQRFDAALRRYVARHRFGIARPADLRAAFAANGDTPGLAELDSAFGLAAEAAG